VTGSPIIVGAIPQKENSSSPIRAIIIPLRTAEGRLKSFPINCSVEIAVKQRAFLADLLQRVENIYPYFPFEFSLAKLRMFWMTGETPVHPRHGFGLIDKRLSFLSLAVLKAIVIAILPASTLRRHFRSNWRNRRWQLGGK
jgi:hypothetical protein